MKFLFLAAALTLSSCSGTGNTDLSITIPPHSQTSDSAGIGGPEIMTATPADNLSASVNQADADVLFVKAIHQDESWTFTVTVTHPDTGWDDYCNGWDVLTQDGKVLKVTEDDSFTRPLSHPHVSEQPFTRSQSGIIIPAGTTQLQVRAHDILHGFGGKEITIHLDQDSGEGFEIVK